MLTRVWLRVVYPGHSTGSATWRFTQVEYGSATLCQVIVQRDPCREDTHRRLMRCFGRQGQTHLALRQYQVCADALEPSWPSTPARPPCTSRDQIRSHQPV